MLRPAVLLAAVTVAVAGPVQAQAHMAQHHPRGAKINVTGTIVHPLCRFAHELPDSAQACAQQHPSAGLEPVLIAEGELYLLAFDHEGASRGVPTAAFEFGSPDATGRRWESGGEACGGAGQALIVTFEFPPVCAQ